MHRTVGQQVSSYGAIHEHVPQRYLVQQWELFLERAQTPESLGKLTNFVGEMWQSETAKIFVPKRSFRGLSPGNPYAAAQTQGEYVEVRPTAVALRLISCREQLADEWLTLLPTLLEQKGIDAATPTAPNASAVASAPAVVSAPAPAAVATGGLDGLATCDKQLLLGIATKLAVRQMLRDLKLRPSKAHLHEWLQTYLLVQHATDLTARGSVERLHADLVAQPICIRGGALVDPLDISMEIFQRSWQFLEDIEEDLYYAAEHVTPLTSGFLETCLRL